MSTLRLKAYDIFKHTKQEKIDKAFFLIQHINWCRCRKEKKNCVIFVISQNRIIVCRNDIECFKRFKRLNKVLEL